MKTFLPVITLLVSFASNAQWRADGPPSLHDTYYLQLYVDKCADGSCKSGGTGTVQFKSYSDIKEYTGTFGQRGSFRQGKVTFRNGDSFEGSFTERPFSGKDVYILYDSGTYHKAGAYTYAAKFINEKPNGPTVIHFDDGGEYRGALNDGYYEGPSSNRFGGGGSYTGNYHLGNFEGRGRMEYSNGLTYDGDWVAGKRSGSGTFTDKTKPGYWFTGQFSNDYPNGPGKLILPDSPDTIIGQFTNGHHNGIFAVKKRGSGATTYTYYQKDSVIYAGMALLPEDRYCVKGTCQAGQGKMMDKDGNRYEGTMKAGRLDGPGSTIYADGSKFTGTYAAGKPVQGHAVFTNGNEYEGQYIDGAFGGQGIYRWPDGSSYTGTWEKGAMKGRGVYVWGGGNKKGNRYEGEFADGRITGQGMLRQADGSVYNGRFNGGDFADGTYTLADGTVYESNAWGNSGFTTGTRRRNGVTEKGKFTGTEFLTAAQVQASDYADKHPWLQGTIPVDRRKADMHSSLAQRGERTTHLVREVNLANGSYSVVTDWDMLSSFNGGFKEYYILAGAAGKNYPVPFGIRITYEFIDSKGTLISRLETSSDTGFEGVLDAPTDGKYTIQAKFDYKGCIGCREADGVRLKFTLISIDYMYPNP